MRPCGTLNSSYYVGTKEEYDDTYSSKVYTRASESGAVVRVHVRVCVCACVCVCVLALSGGELHPIQAIESTADSVVNS